MQTSRGTTRTVPAKKAPRKTRAYHQEARAQQTEANIQGIVDATVALVRSARRVSEITLDHIAERCGLTVRTILRRFGSRDGLMALAFTQIQSEIDGSKVRTPAGDIDSALKSLLSQYEEMGDLNIRALEEEDQIPQLHEMLQFGRASHREWLRSTFGPHLAGKGAEEQEQWLTTYYAATEVYLWKVLRRDLGLDRDQTAATFRRLVDGVMMLARDDSRKPNKERDAKTGEQYDNVGNERRSGK
ncbi:MAG: TetR/AcrR family transcriptional regulator [Bryobacteraceae bacterium]